VQPGQPQPDFANRKESSVGRVITDQAFKCPGCGVVNWDRFSFTAGWRKKPHSG